MMGLSIRMLNPYLDNHSLFKFKNKIKGMRFFFVICIIACLSSCAATFPEFEKINGVSFVASKDSILEDHVNPVVRLSANYAAIMPFGFIRDLENPEVIFNKDRQWYGETIEGAKQYTLTLREKGIKVMMKPQIWVWRGQFTGHIKMNSEEDWKILEDTYSDFILSYAKLAEELNLELFCIGTELEQFITQRTDYWLELIQEIKNVYKGKLTYAANWDEFTRTPFWEALDFIGVDAYFPVSENKTPTIEDCKRGWNKHVDRIEDMANSYNKPILFTEFGYRSVDYTGKEPWDSDRNKSEVNLEGQANATQALLETFWNKPWFAGGFVWKWFHRHEGVGGNNNFMFTPQNKPAEGIIKATYSSY